MTESTLYMRMDSKVHRRLYDVEGHIKVDLDTSTRTLLTPYNGLKERFVHMRKRANILAYDGASMYTMLSTGLYKYAFELEKASSDWDLEESHVANEEYTEEEMSTLNATADEVLYLAFKGSRTSSPYLVYKSGPNETGLSTPIPEAIKGWYVKAFVKGDVSEGRYEPVTVSEVLSEEVQSLIYGQLPSRNKRKRHDDDDVDAGNERELSR